MSLTVGFFGALIGTLYTTLRGDKKSRIDESSERVADAAISSSTNKQSIPEPETPQVQPAFEFLQKVAAHNQFEVTEHERDENWVTCTFEYQGGWFVCYCGVGNDEILLQYRNFADLPYSSENYQRVMSLCHRYTRQYSYAKFVNSYDAENNKLLLHILVESIGPSEAAFMYFVVMCFGFANDIRQELLGNSVDEEEIISLQRDRYMLIDAEMAHEENLFRQRYPKAKNPNEGTIKEYLDYLFDGEQVEDLISLTVQSAGAIQEISQKDKIASYDLLGSMITGVGEDADFASSTPVVLTIDATTKHYVITLHPLESGKNFLSARMTAVCTPHEFLQDYVPTATYEPKALSMRLCYVKTELPESERQEDRELPSTNLAKQLSHGHQLMQQHGYIQAVAVLTPVFHTLKPKFFDLKDNEKEMFFSACFYLGFCYTELRQYEKAYYYLDLANGCNRFDYSQEYFNCLANGQDIRVFRELSKETDAISKRIEEIDKDDDRGTESMMEQRNRLVDYYAFLQRRRGYSQINFGYLDDAKETFKQLLDHEGSRAYAEQELKYIEKIRNQKRNG